MKLGAYLGYWGEAMGSNDLMGTVQEAERLGHDSVEIVGTLLVAPMAFTTEDRIAQLREVSELAAG